jgi:hypothetical protein
MTRRDRAALQLAYECLRSSVVGRTYWWSKCCHAEEVLRHCEDMRVARALSRELRWVQHRIDPGDQLVRVLFVRLALLLRVLLRADAGDFGQLVCDACGEVATSSRQHGNPCNSYRAGLGCTRGRVGRYAWSRVRPLWLDAPASEGTR